MKVVILAAGRPDQCKKGRFPVGSKPKCLFHYKGEVLLERQVKTLRAVGLNDITVVVGHQKEMIERLNSQRGLGLKLVYNPTGATDVKKPRRVKGFDYLKVVWSKGFDSLKAGIQGVDDDVLFIPGDVYLQEEGLRKVLDTECSVIGKGGHKGRGYQLFKVRRNVLSSIRAFEGVGLFYPLHDLIVADGGTFVDTGIADVDLYRRMDEGRK